MRRPASRPVDAEGEFFNAKARRREEDQEERRELRALGVIFAFFAFFAFFAVKISFRLRHE